MNNIDAAREFNECPVCHRDIQCYVAKHYAAGKLCTGTPVIVRYIREDARSLNNWKVIEVDGLPDNGETVWVTRIDFDVRGVDLAWLVNGNEWWSDEDRSPIPTGTQIIAWQPLNAPEPYRKETER